MLRKPELTSKKDKPYASGLKWDLRIVCVELKKHGSLYPKAQGQPVPIGYLGVPLFTWKRKLDHLAQHWN